MPFLNVVILVRGIFNSLPVMLGENSPLRNQICPTLLKVMIYGCNEAQMSGLLRRTLKAICSPVTYSNKHAM